MSNKDYLGLKVCLNCGRPATETCSGCNLARYCGATCQHRDWEVGGHQVVCREKSLLGVVKLEVPDTK